MIEQADTYPLVGRIADLPAQQRPREYAHRVGIENVPEQVLLALILRTGARGINAAQLAQQLLTTYGSLTELAKAPEEELCAVKGMGPVSAQVLKAALEMARRLAAESVPERAAMRTPQDVAALLEAGARTLDHEEFWVLLLDSKNRILGRPEVVTRGVLDASLVHPREVFRRAIRVGCAAVVLAHNHPSGDPAPSAEDVRVTRQLVEAGRLLDIRVLDHVILGRSTGNGTAEHFSMRESGVVSFG